MALYGFQNSAWTDHNPSDPGITLWDSLQYVLADLHYRINFDIRDHLANTINEPYQDLYSVGSIQHNAPWHTDDYQKMLLDLERVENAWIDIDSSNKLAFLPSGEVPSLVKTDSNIPDDALTFYLRGLYRVAMEAPAEALAEINARLQSNRNLCEDFVSVVPLNAIRIEIGADITFRNHFTGSIEKLLAWIYFNLENFINRYIAFYRLSELLNQNLTNEEIFQGPALEHGFLNTQDVRKIAQKQVSLRASDLITEILKTDNNLIVSSLVLYRDGVSDLWELPLPHDLAPSLEIPDYSILENSNLENSDKPRRIRIYLNQPAAVEKEPSPGNQIGNELVPNQAVFEAELEELRRTRERSIPRNEEKDRLLAPGRRRDTGHYHAAQNELPGIFGVGQQGPPFPGGDTASDARRMAQARQLKAYLMFFDQILAQHFAQLADVRDLFLFKEGATYFDQVPESVSRLSEVLTHSLPEFETNLKTLTEDEATQLDRRNRWLDHLLARFGEEFTEYETVMKQYLSDYPTLVVPQLIRDKIQFLLDYPACSGQRNRGFDYTQPVLETENISGYQRRVYRRLGISDLGFRRLAWQLDDQEHLIRPTSPRQNGKFSLKNHNGVPIINSIKNYRGNSPDLKTDIDKTIYIGRYRDAYYVVRRPRLLGFVFEIRDKDGTGLAESARLYRSISEAETAIEGTVAFIRTEEGFHTLEHILLRPQMEELNEQPGCPLLALPSDPDPYSAQLSVFIPIRQSVLNPKSRVWLRRFNDNNFKNLLERTLREEAPAHVKVHIYWLSPDKMRDFEDKYLSWLEALRQYNISGGNPLRLIQSRNELIETLQSGNYILGYPYPVTYGITIELLTPVILIQEKGRIKLSFSESDVVYCISAEQYGQGETVSGNNGEIELFTPKFNRAGIYHCKILALKTRDKLRLKVYFRQEISISVCSELVFENHLSNTKYIAKNEKVKLIIKGPEPSVEYQLFCIPPREPLAISDPVSIFYPVPNQVLIETKAIREDVSPVYLRISRERPAEVITIPAKLHILLWNPVPGYEIKVHEFLTIAVPKFPIPYNTHAFIIILRPETGFQYQLLFATNRKPAGPPIDVTSAQMQINLSAGQLKRTTSFYIYRKNLGTGQEETIGNPIQIKVKALNS